MFNDGGQRRVVHRTIRRVTGHVQHRALEASMRYFYMVRSHSGMFFSN